MVVCMLCVCVLCVRVTCACARVRACVRACVQVCVCVERRRTEVIDEDGAAILATLGKAMEACQPAATRVSEQSKGG